MLLGAAVVPGRIAFGLAAPERIDVHDGEGAVPLRGNDDLPGDPVVVHYLVGREEAFDQYPPALLVIAAHAQYPVHGIV